MWHTLHANTGVVCHWETRGKLSTISAQPVPIVTVGVVSGVSPSGWRSVHVWCGGLGPRRGRTTAVTSISLNVVIAQDASGAFHFPKV